MVDFVWMGSGKVPGNQKNTNLNKFAVVWVVSLAFWTCLSEQIRQFLATLLQLKQASCATRGMKKF